MKKFLGYALFTICVTIFMLYYQFPEDIAVQLVKSKANEFAPQLNIDLESIAPSFPPGIKLKGLTIDNAKMRLVKADAMSVQPEFVSILRLKPSMSFYCKAYSGEMKGDFGIMQLQAIWKQKPLPLTFNIKWRNIQLNQIDALKQIPYELEGLFFGLFSYEGISGAWMDGSGTLKAIVENGNITLQKPILQAIKNIQFKRFDAEFSFKNKVIQLLQSNINGDIEGSLSGTITLHPIFIRSQISITGKIKPSQDYINKSKLPIKAFIKPDKLKNGIPVTLTGTIQRPVFNTM
jgi:type II secretion system protein N